MPSNPIAANTTRSIQSSTTSRSAPAKRSTRIVSRPRRSWAAMASTFVGNVRNDGSARTTSFSSCCWSMSDFWSASSGRSAVASCAMLNEGSMVRSVPSSVSSARESTVIAPGTSSPWRCITSSIRLIACGSKLPEPRPSREHQADVGFEGAAVAALVATREVHRSRAPARPGR